LQSEPFGPDVVSRTSPKRRISQSNHRLVAELGACDIASVEARALRPLELDAPPSGSKPLAWLDGPDATRWVFKATALALASVEQLAFELRMLGRRPCVAARVIELELGDLGHVSGVLKPFIEFDSSDELSADTTSWTDLQRAVMLAEHAWEWLLDDLDANLGQYALLGPERHPVKLDWDRAFSSPEPGPPSRFDKYKAILPNARGFLYADWLEARVELDFDLLRDEARRIARLPAERVRRALEAHVRRAGLEPEPGRELVARGLDRQRRVPQEFERFVRQLKRERRALTPGTRSTLAPAMRSGSARLWRLWQLLLNGVFRGPVGDAGRVVLRAWRTRAVRKHGHESPA
jgi:hypothetical protein